MAQLEPTGCTVWLPGFGYVEVEVSGAPDGRAGRGWSVMR